MARGSLLVLADQVRVEREVQLRHLEALDSKAGVAIGFLGALVALAGTSAGVLGGVGQILAASASLVALVAFAKRRYPTLGMGVIRRRFLSADPEFTQLHLLDTQMEILVDASNILDAKSRWLTLSFVLLVAGVVSLGIGLVLA